MTIKERFGLDYGVPTYQVNSLALFANNAARLNEKACNGDPHPLNAEPADKAANSELWSDDLDKVTQDILTRAIKYGFTGVVYTGLRPCLRRGDKFVEIPA